MVEAGFLTEGQYPDRAAQPGDADRPQARHDAGLLPRLGFRAGQEARREGKLGNDRVVVVKTPLDQGIQRKVEEASE